jgi:thiosulfate dehydrogenase [quinone] large subunit
MVRRRKDFVEFNMKRFSDQELAYGLLRFAFGVNFFGHGLVRVIMGDGKFADGVIKGFHGSVLPDVLVTPVSYAIPYIELALGIALLTGLLTRFASLAGGLFMCLLTFGSLMKNDMAAAGGQLLYSVVFSILLFQIQYNGLSLDRAFGRHEANGIQP